MSHTTTNTFQFSLRPRHSVTTVTQNRYHSINATESSSPAHSGHITHATMIICRIPWDPCFILILKHQPTSNPTRDQESWVSQRKFRHFVFLQVKLFQKSRDHGELVPACSEAAADGEGVQQAGGVWPPHQHPQQGSQVSHNNSLFLDAGEKFSDSF